MLLSDEILSAPQTAVYGTLVLRRSERGVGQLQVGWSGPIGCGALTWPRKSAGDANHQWPTVKRPALAGLASSVEAAVSAALI
jgi:hypothetical protein